MKILGKPQLIAVIITFSFFMIMSTAEAAPDPGFGSFLVNLVKNFLVNPTEWLTDIWKTVGPAGVNLPKIIQFISIALLLLGIIWSGLRIVSLGSSVELQTFFVRALLAGALVTSGPWMGDLLRKTWVDCYTWSHAKITEPVTTQATDELQNLAITLTALSVAYIAAPAIGEAAKAAMGKSFKDASTDALDGVKDNAGTILELVKYVLFSVGAIVTVEYVVVILTGFAIIIASLMIPFAGVMLIFPGNAMQSWFATWFRSASGAILLVLLHPIAYVAALQIGFIKPAQKFNASLKDTTDQLQSAVDKLKSLIPSGGPDITKIPEWFQNAWSAVNGSLQDVASAGTTLLFGTITSIVMLFIGIAFAVLFVYAAQTQIMAFIGSIVGGGAGRGANMTPLAAAGAGFAGAAMGVASGAGEMGQLAMNKFTGGGGAPSSTPGGDSGGGGSGGGGSGGGGRGPNESADAYSDRLSQEQNDWAKNDFDERLANSSGGGGGQPGGPQAGGGQPGGPQGGGGSSGGPRAGGGQGGPRAGSGGSSGGATAAEVGEVAEEAAPLLLL
jgi:hypothetical protein